MAVDAIETHQAKCLCGEVEFSADVKTDGLHVCHCDYCRVWSGGVFMGVEAARIAFDIDKLDLLSVYGSSDWAERVFCKKCGTNLVWRMQDGSHKVVSISALQPRVDLPLTTELFIDRKPAGYSFAQDTTKLTEAELMAMMEAQQQ